MSPESARRAAEPGTARLGFRLPAVRPGAPVRPGPAAAHSSTSLRRKPASQQARPPVVGDLDLSFEALELPSAAGLFLVIYTAEPGSPTQQALDLLASWATTEAQHVSS